MIGFLQGTILIKKVDSVVLLNRGVGYQLECPASTLWTMPLEGQEASLFVSTYVREDAIRLFGFVTDLDKQVFETLIGVSSVGPKLALSLLGPFTGEDLVHALYLKETAKLLAVPGVGQRKLEKLLVEMGPKVEKLWAMCLGMNHDKSRADRPEDGELPPSGTESKTQSKLFEDEALIQNQLSLSRDAAREQSYKRSSLLKDLESALINIGHKEKFIRPCLEWVQDEWKAGHLEETLEASLRTILTKQSARLVSALPDAEENETRAGDDRATAKIKVEHSRKAEHSGSQRFKATRHQSQVNRGKDLES